MRTEAGNLSMIGFVLARVHGVSKRRCQRAWRHRLQGPPRSLLMRMNGGRPQVRVSPRRMQINSCSCANERPAAPPPEFCLGVGGVTLCLREQFHARVGEE